MPTFEEFLKDNEPALKALYEAWVSNGAPGKWEPKGGGFFIDSNGVVISVETEAGYLTFGTERKTKELAEKALIKMRQHNRALAFVDEACGGYDFVPLNNYHVYYDHINGIYAMGNNYQTTSIGTVYGPKEVMIDLANKLNSREVVL